MATNQSIFSGDDGEWIPPKGGLIDWADEMERISPEAKQPKPPLPEPSLPEPQNYTDEAKGTRTEVTFRYNAKNQKEKITRTYKIEKTVVSKGIHLRKEWTKFGEAVRDKDGVDSGTTKDSEDIIFRLTTNKDDLELGITKDLSAIVDLVSQFNKETAPANPTAPEDKTNQGSIYVPPKRIGFAPDGGFGGGGYNLDDPIPAVKISNLSLDTTEQDVKELLVSFGRLSRLHMPKDRRNKDSHKGVAFATFYRRDIGERVISKLHGYAYDHLILKVEWSKSQRKN